MLIVVDVDVVVGSEATGYTEVVHSIMCTNSDLKKKLMHDLLQLL